MNPKKNAKYKFRKAWSWPEDVDRKIRALCEGFTLHVCNGESTIGDVRIDIEKKAEIQASMYFLPIRPGAFGAGQSKGILSTVKGWFVNKK